MMKRFLGIFRFEFGMMIRRRGLWLTYAILFLFHGFSFIGPRIGDPSFLSRQNEWSTAGNIVFVLNLFMPLVAGIAAADRLIRDGRLGVRELQRGAPMGRGVYLLGKYAGVLAGAITPLFAIVLTIGLIFMMAFKASPSFVIALLAAWLAISLPAYAFVVAFSLAFPMILPLRVYQVLFTGYWFWGNYLNPKVMPTLNGTILTPGGAFALQGFFGGIVGVSDAAVRHSAAGAVVNLAVIFSCAATALTAAALFMARRERDA